MAKNLQVDMTSGKIFKKMFIFALPFIIMNVMQNLFNLADVAVVGAFVDDIAVAAVGSNASIINLIIALFVGLSVSSNIIVAKLIGAKRESETGKVVGTSITLSLVFGVFLAGVGIALARVILKATGSPAEVIDLATLYLRIYFAGMPVIMLYNFCASILRASGDTFLPMIYIIIAGVINVGLNIFLVVVCHLSVAGVAIATITSQAFSGIACLVTILKRRKQFNLTKKDFIPDLKTFKEILIIGLPSGVQGSLFAFSNLIILTAKNSLGASFLSANSLCNQFENIFFAMGDAVAVSVISFISQNYGARNYDRMLKSIFCAVGLIAIIQALSLSIFLPCSRGIFGLMTEDPEIIEMAVTQSFVLTPMYLLCNCMGVLANAFKGLGKTLTSMLIVLFGTCLLRILYIKIIFPIKSTIVTVFLVYPISWGFTIIVLIAFLIPLLKKVKKELTAENAQI